MSNLFKNVLIVIAPLPKKNGKPSRFMINRIRKAIQLSKKKKYSRIILSGGPSKKSPIPSADVLKIMSTQYLEQKNVLTERNSKDLLHNALFCWELIKDHEPKKITVITNQYELKRAKFIFKKTYQHLNVSLIFETCLDNVDIFEATYLSIKEFMLLKNIEWNGIK